jgi:hypothetical protein
MQAYVLGHVAEVVPAGNAVAWKLVASKGGVTRGTQRGVSSVGNSRRMNAHGLLDTVYNADVHGWDRLVCRRRVNGSRRGYGLGGVRCRGEQNAGGEILHMHVLQGGIPRASPFAAASARRHDLLIVHYGLVPMHAVSDDGRSKFVSENTGCLCRIGVVNAVVTAHSSGDVVELKLW